MTRAQRYAARKSEAGLCTLGGCFDPVELNPVTGRPKRRCRACQEIQEIKKCERRRPGMGHTINDRMEAFFRERPNEWIDGRILAEQFGFYAWRSRCSDLRKRGLTIENDQRTVTRDNGSKYKRSLYRFVAPKGQMALEI